MQNLIQAHALRRIRENYMPQLASVHVAVRVQDFSAELADHFVVGLLPLLKQFVPQRVRIQHRTVQFAQHRRDRGFPGCDAAGEANAQHQRGTAAAAGGLAVRRAPRRSRAALMVLLINMAMVSGPTPPGTGVSAPATLATSGCTSPTSAVPFSRKAARRSGKCAKKFSACAASLMRLMPTSITVAPGRTKSGVTIPARPKAATTMSARRTTSGKLRVFEWQIVTVRSRASAEAPSACRRYRCGPAPRRLHLPAESRCAGKFPVLRKACKLPRGGA